MLATFPAVYREATALTFIPAAHSPASERHLLLLHSGTSENPSFRLDRNQTNGLSWNGRLAEREIGPDCWMCKLYLLTFLFCFSSLFKCKCDLISSWLLVCLCYAVSAVHVWHTSSISSSHIIWDQRPVPLQLWSALTLPLHPHIFNS